MDIDWVENFEFLRQHKVVNVPALVCFKNGQHVETVIGLHTKQVLFDTIEAVSK
jgi:thiol:disulfide interchange protein